MIKTLMNSLENKEEFSDVRFDDLRLYLSQTDFSYFSEANFIKAVSFGQEYYINLRLVKKISFTKTEASDPFANKQNLK